MTRQELNRKDSIANQFMQVLYSGVPQSDHRLQLERRRLIAKLGAIESSPKDRLSIRAYALALGTIAALFTTALIALKSPQKDPINFSGLWQVRPGDTFSKGQTIEIPRGQGAKMILKDETTLWLGGQSEIQALNNRMSGFRLSKGRLLAQVAKQQGNQRFVIETAHGTVVVKGTLFSVSVVDQKLSVRLYQGAVHVVVKDSVIDIPKRHQIQLGPQINRTPKPIGPVDLITDSMIGEKTSALGGPKLPTLMAARTPVQKTANIDKVQTSPATLPFEAGNKRPKKKQIKSKKARGDQDDRIPKIAVDSGVPKTEFVDPELEQIKVEFQETTKAADLFIKALDDIQSGNHGQARKQLEKYLHQYPDDRYWRRINDILGQ